MTFRFYIIRKPSYLHAPGGGCATTHESLAGALGIPELMPPNRRRTFKENLHAPGSVLPEKGVRMILNFLGCGCAYRPQLGNTSAWFKTDGHLFLLDCGETVFTCLRQSPLLTCCQDITILVTHSHGDHIGSLPTLISYMHDVEQKPVTVCFPQEDITAWMDCCGISRDDYRLLQGADMTLASGIDCHAFPVEHHPALPCYGYHITYHSKSFYYSGDARRLPPKILEAFLHGKIDELYQDSTFLHEQGNSHGSLDALCGAIPPALRSRVYPMHFSDDFFEVIQMKGFGLCMEKLRNAK